MLPAPRRHTRVAPTWLLRAGAAALSGLLLVAALAPGAWGRAKHQRRQRGRSARTFYVAENGSDQSSGLSQADPWQTIDRVNAAQLRPGDEVLFHGGETFADDTLMPGWGFGVSGTQRRPITFGTYGSPRASLPDGVWLGTDAAHPGGPSHLTFKNLSLGPEQGFQGTGSWIKLTGMKIGGLERGSQSEVGILTEGSHWVISHSYISHTGDSGMLLGFTAGYAGAPAGGSDYLISHDTIAGTGEDPALTYGTHGIYDKVTNATIEDNVIVGFHNDGVSARYPGARVIGNIIAHGSIGIGWFQYGRQAGTVRFVGNDISDTSSAGIFVCGVAEGCWRPRGHFVIARNRLVHAHGAVLNLQPVLGHYTVYSNR